MIEKLSLRDLQALQAKMQEIIEVQAMQERRVALKTLSETATELGYDLRELVAEEFQLEHGQLKPRSTVKYRHPNDPKLTWSGRGRQPHWFKALVRSGVDPESLYADQNGSY